MTQQNHVVKFDPYFDGDTNANNQVTANGLIQPNVGQGYVDPGQVQTVSGTIATSLPPGPSGLRGTVIPRATMGGIPQGTNPHSTQDTIVNIDPHIEGQSSVVRLGDLTAASVEQATRDAEGQTPEPYDVATMRVRGAAVMHNIATTVARQKQAAVAPPQQAVQQQPQPMQPQPMTQQPPLGQQPAAAAIMNPMPVQQQRQISPLAAFGQQAAPAPPPVQVVDTSQFAQPSLPPVAAPNVAVIFEIQHFGNMEARYHDVVITDNFLVLIFDNRHKGSVKYFPPVTTGHDTPPMAVNIIGTTEVYLVKTTGIQYVHDDAEHCILMVEQSGTLPPTG